MPVEPWFLELLACPVCRGKLVEAADEDGLVCAACRVLYPIVDEVPQLLPESGRPLDGADDRRP
ncbi:MAG: Trm112 family protein [Candidatus Polarisedimenticolia bacterium]|nr:Trm112 family protein [bacterium]